MTPVQLRFIYWIKERELIRIRKENGDPLPWTKDAILRDHRFCNVNREHDAVTRWIARHVRPRLINLPLAEVVFQLYVCRVFNQPDVLREIMPVVTIPTMVQRLKARKAAGLKILRGAYLVVPHGTSMPVEDFYAAVAAKVRALRYPSCPTLAQVAATMMTVKGIHDFMANQVCADLRYQPGHCRWPDWGTFVLAGPGTLRGLARWGGATIPPRGTKGRRLPSISAPSALLLTIRDQVVPLLPPEIAAYLKDPNNLSNCFCEMSKYEKMREGTGTMKLYRHSYDDSILS
jgi:hypothetical protein